MNNGLICPSCSLDNSIDVEFCVRCKTNLAGNQWANDYSQRSNGAESLTMIKADGKIQIVANNPAQAKLAIKSLKNIKKDYQLQKKQIIAKMQELRANYTHSVRMQGSKTRGGGFLGKIFRAVETVSRDGKRAGLAQQLVPFENAKRHVETVIMNLEKAEIQLQAYILENQ